MHVLSLVLTFGDPDPSAPRAPESLWATGALAAAMAVLVLALGLWAWAAATRNSERARLGRAWAWRGVFATVGVALAVMMIDVSYAWPG